MLINNILNKNKWLEFLNYKLEKDFVNQKDKEKLSFFIKNKKYKKIGKLIKKGKYTFSTPHKHVISKNKNSKKRIVYNYLEEEMIILKYISYLLYDYDSLFCPNLYSFRKNRGVKNAIINISNIKNIKKMYGYKVDISNYFNSINPQKLLLNLKDDLNDSLLFNLIKDLLSNEYCLENNIYIKENKGIMAGTPISAFLANYYLKDMDKFFWQERLVYFRYADDIIIFCNTKEDLRKYQKLLNDFLKEYQLTINKKKELFINPGEPWEFLGFSFNNNTIDLSQNSLYKIKGKIRRSGRGIRRWMLKNNASYENALKAMIRRYNKKFFGNVYKSELSWKYWFFPSINTDKSLKIVDNYLQETLRYIVTGKHNKKNYEKVPYNLLKKCHYRSLVNEYYNFIV